MDSTLIEELNYKNTCSILNDLITAVIRSFYSDIEEVILLDIIETKTCSFESLYKSTQFNETILRSSLNTLINHGLLDKMEVNLTEKEFEEDSNPTKRKKKNSSSYYFIPYHSVFNTIETRLKNLNEKFKIDSNQNTYKCENCNEKYSTMDFARMCTKDGISLCSQCCLSLFHIYPIEIKIGESKSEQYSNIRLLSMDNEISEERNTIFQLREEFNQLLNSKNSTDKGQTINDIVTEYNNYHKHIEIKEMDINRIKDSLLENLSQKRRKIIISLSDSKDEQTPKEILHSFLKRTVSYDLGQGRLVNLKSSFCPFGKIPLSSVDQDSYNNDDDDDDDDDDDIDWEDG
jgi:transcription initiation factor IIE alpha subunit